ncbi:AAA family ATPase [Candidatus Lucifugimonas marina]|uniref:AAA family ATPase n=1 Tax=Candidatus Lucifugimonas marina TaxID=3038979 RepID=A0AAJ5ZGS2_9CHLR|nr:AAA family ATPase [SAR202 cluster bacterium JH702]MDG0869310.1 AAA family ATPase [SAR202 cluster bacterium JH639]WFG36711.1 AAA family ATPase [SAR202 cluster bacterium JH545]WFG40645.1 AAA family ATPase [SAR202 cluster bacterium JH1073]
MRLTGINIENFGPFAGRDFDDMSNRLTLLHGPNEAGKSALRAFLRSTLFGYTTKADKASIRELFTYKHFKPEPGSGQISFVTSSDTNFNIHRRDGKKRGEVSITGDANGSDDLLRTLLGGIDAELYTNVFSISLSELQVISSLNSDQIRDKIYSVGLGLANVSLTDARAELDGELHKLRSTTGRAGSMSKNQKSLTELRTKLEETRRGSDEYAALSSSLEQLVENIDSQTAELEDMRSGIERQKTLVNIRKPWDRKTEIERQISELPENDMIPEDGQQQLDNLVEQKTALQSQMDDGELRQQERKTESESVGVVEAFLDDQHGEETRKLLMETAYYTKAVTDLPEVEQELEKEQAQLDRDLAELGWSEQAVSKFETPMDLQSNLESAGRELTAARRTYQEAELTVQSRTEDRETMADEAMKSAGARDALTDVPKEISADLEKKRDRLSRLRAAIADAGSIRSEMNEAQKNLSDALAQTETEDIGGFVGSILLPITVIIVGIASMAWSYMQAELSGGLAGLLGLVAGFMLISRARAAGGFKITIRKPAISEAKDVANVQVEEIQERLDAVNKEISEIAGEFGISDTPSIRDVEEKAGELDRSLDLRRRFESVSREFETAASRLATIDTRLTEAHSSLALSANTLADVQNRWQLLLERSELRIDLDPAQAANVMASIRTLKSQQRTTASLRMRVSQMSDTAGEIDFRLSEILEAAGLPEAPAQAGTQALEDLAMRLKAHDEAVVRQSQIAAEMENWTAEFETLETRMSELDAKIGSLLEKGETYDHEEFKATAIQVQERRELERKLSELLENTPLLSNDDGQSYRDDLIATPHEEAVARLQQLEDEEKRLRSVVDGLHVEQGNLLRQRSEFEKSGQALELHSKINMLEEKIARDAQRWAVLTIARDVFERTREEFQQERQPALIRSASKYLSDLTLGRYTSVRAVIGEKDQDLEVVEGEGHTKRANELSRGTAEQLFLAMRFALIEEYAKNAEPMPVVLDDILVNFDPERAKAACKVIMDLSERFQVIFLTCHPETEAMFKSVAPTGKKARAEAMSVVELTSSAAAERLTLVEPA